MKIGIPRFHSIVLGLQDSTETITAFAYIWANVDDPDLYGEWKFDVSFLPSCSS